MTDAGGSCTFCGRKVALNYRGTDDASDAAPAEASDQQLPAGEGGGWSVFEH
jgi:hypothetical protein